MPNSLYYAYVDAAYAYASALIDGDPSVVWKARTACLAALDAYMGRTTA